jgi:3-oxoacyl-[acyl-carrier-protein] synthase-1
MRLYLNDCGVICPLGANRASVVQGIAQGRRRFVEREALIPGRSVLVGAVTTDLPPVPPEVADLDCRNNRLMLAALAQIATTVTAATARYGRSRVAVVLGTSTAGIAEGEAALAARRRDGHWPAGFHYRQQEPGGMSAFAARVFELTGPAYTVTTACSSSAKVFASARRLIRSGVADAAVVGGADTLCRMTLNGFAGLEALSQGACNPFSLNRDGITIGEGAAAFLMSGETGPVELLGVGETSDAYHPAAPDPTGSGAREAMAQALADAGLSPEGIGYINLHGTATALNDAMESLAVAALFPPATPCSSTKAMTGHMLGGTGGVEAALLWLGLAPAGGLSMLPPHLWDGVADPSLPQLALVVPGMPVPQRGPLAMLSNSFGFGGSNVSLILGRG